MTERANSLTERVTTPADKAGFAWTMPANDVRALMGAIGRLGYSAASLLIEPFPTAFAHDEV